MPAESFVSILTPFYNTEYYIAECIESVLSQTYQNWDYILLDNCSTDGSLAIVMKYVNSDKRIKLIRNDHHLPQVENYNRAMELISPQSKYCKIVQADDMIFPTCIAEMVKVAESCGSIAIVGSYYLKGDSVEGTGAPFPSPIISGRDACRKHLLQGQYLFGSPTSVMYTSEVVRNRRPFYAYGTYLEDTESCYDLLKEHDFGFVYQVLSFTRTDNCSISSKLTYYNPNLLNKYILVSKYGKFYLTEGEFKQVLKEISSNYYAFLGAKSLQNRSQDFWEYHKKGLRYIGDDLSILKIFWYTSYKVLSNLLNIKKMLGYFTS